MVSSLDQTFTERECKLVLPAPRPARPAAADARLCDRSAGATQKVLQFALPGLELSVLTH